MRRHSKGYGYVQGVSKNEEKVEEKEQKEETLEVRAKSEENVEEQQSDEEQKVDEMDEAREEEQQEEEVERPTTDVQQLLNSLTGVFVYCFCDKVSLCRTTTRRRCIVVCGASVRTVRSNA